MNLEYTNRLYIKDFNEQIFDLIIYILILFGLNSISFIIFLIMFFKIKRWCQVFQYNIK